MDINTVVLFYKAIPSAMTSGLIKGMAFLGGGGTVIIGMAFLEGVTVIKGMAFLEGAAY